MPRYIDEKDVYALVEPSGIAKVHCSQIDELPRADVVPKSEVEKIFETIEKLATEGGVIWTNYARAVLNELKKNYIEQCLSCKHFVGCEEAVWSGRCEDFDSVRKEDEIYEKGYNDALKDVEEMILERKNENTPKI